MNIDKAVNLDEIREAARRKLPRIAFDFIDGGADDEIGMQRNREAFRRYCVVPRYLVDVSKPDQSVTLFGQTYASPIGISPTGMGGLFRPNADLMLAEAAARANVPYLMSSASSNSIEAASKGGNGAPPPRILTSGVRWPSSNANQPISTSGGTSPWNLRRTWSGLMCLG